MSSLLCETVTGDTMAQLEEARNAAIGADLVELRLDGVKGLEVERALRGRQTPVIVTCRPTWEGGRFSGSEEERRAVLRRALGLGAEYVDVEWRTLQGQGGVRFDELVEMDAARVVVSSHDFGGVPADLCTRARAMRATGAAVIKVAVTVSRLSDTLPLLDIAKGGNAVVIGMGDAGVPTRLLASRFGSRWTYGGHGVAPGQMPAARMLREFRFRSIGVGTSLYGVVGSSAMHSLSPVMHNAAFAAAGLDAVCVPLVAADFADFLTFADAIGLRGASITVPYKIDALTAARSTDDLTHRVGAANTLRRVEDGWEATNTDVDGFLDALAGLLGDRRLWDADRGSGTGPPAGRANLSRPIADPLRASVLGAGGSSRAVVVALMTCGARVTVHARRRDQAEAVAASFGIDAGQWPPAPDSWDLLVNCTPLGGSADPDASPVPAGALGGRWVYDLNYRHGELPLVRNARRSGLQAIDGLPMLIAQAERQFRWWTGQRPGPGVMRAAARDNH